MDSPDNYEGGNVLSPVNDFTSDLYMGKKKKCRSFDLNCSN